MASGAKHLEPASDNTWLEEVNSRGNEEMVTPGGSGVRSLHRRAASDTLACAALNVSSNPMAAEQQSPPSDSNEEGQENRSSNADPKKVRRIIANRQSAQRSRIRKLQYIAELEKSVNSLQMEVSALKPQVSFLDHRRVLLNVDNNVMKQRIAVLVQNVRLKDIHNEALRKESERLGRIYQQQHLDIQQFSGFEQSPAAAATTTATCFKQQQELDNMDPLCRLSASLLPDSNNSTILQQLLPDFQATATNGAGGVLALSLKYQ